MKNRKNRISVTRSSPRRRPRSGFYLSDVDGAEGLRLELLGDVGHGVGYDHGAAVKRVLHSLRGEGGRHMTNSGLNQRTAEAKRNRPSAAPPTDREL